MENTVHGSGGTDFTVSPGGGGWIILASQGHRSGLQGWSGSLTIEESQKLRLLLEEAEIEAAPKPSKADRLREVLRPQEPNDRYYTTGYSTRVSIAERILNEDGDL